MLATHYKKLYFVQSEYDQFNIESISKTISKIKASVGINFGGNAMAIKWQFSKPNNSNIQYNMIVQLPVAIRGLDYNP